MNDMTHESKYVNKAVELYNDQYLCSQAVLAAFAEELGLSVEQALKLGACFGSGMCRGEVCGACTGALMALGLKYGKCEPGAANRAASNSVTLKFLDLFSSENGSYICNDILGCDLTTEEGREYARSSGLFTELCPKMVASAARIAERLMNE